MSSLCDVAQQMERDGRSRMRDVARNRTNIRTDWRATVRKHPLPGLSLAFGAGFAASTVLSKRTPRRTRAQRVLALLAHPRGKVGEEGALQTAVQAMLTVAATRAIEAMISRVLRQRTVARRFRRD